MNTPDTISQRLKEWQLAVPPSRDFKPGVWNRIENQGLGKTWTRLSRTRQSLIGAVCVMAVVLAGWTGHAYARSQAQAERDALAHSYLAQLDARSHTGLQR